MTMGTAARTMARLAILASVVFGMVVLATGCDSEDVTGEPQDISTLIHVIPASSRCVHDADTGTVHFYVGLRNTGGDERLVHVTPVRRFSDGPDVGTSIDSFPVTVPGHADADGDLEVKGVSDDLAGCLVQIDGGDPVEIAVEKAPS